MSDETKTETTKQDKLIEEAEKKSAEDLKNRKEGKVSKSSETKKSKPKAKKSAKKVEDKKAKKPAAKKGAKKAASKKVAKAKNGKKISKADAPLGLNKAGEPRQKSEFDPETTLGQRGKRIKADEFEPNDNEAAVLSCVRRAGKIALTDLAERSFPKNKKANSWTRNALRRLIRARLVKKVGRGEYEKAA